MTLTLQRVLDLDPAAVNVAAYDLFIAASGYESRGTFVSRQVGIGRAPRATVAAFSEHPEHPRRQENDAYFTKVGVPSSLASAGDDLALVRLVSDLPDRSHHLGLCVDYSSMSRLWYAGLLNWARYQECYESVTIDFLYSIGVHNEGDTPMVIEEILPLPGCEGGAAPLSRSVAVFGLGFDGLATHCVLDRLEPDEAYAFLASPGAKPDYAERTRERNRDLVEMMKTVELPLRSVERTFSSLAELVSPDLRHADVTLVAMGPKPHVLASLLLAVRFQEIACLRVSGRRVMPMDVSALGEVVATRVHFRTPGKDAELPKKE